MADGPVGFATKGLHQILADDERISATALHSYRPRDRRVGHAGDNHLASNQAAHALADAESGRSVFAEQAETFGVFH
jgi:hypothetical protein